MSQKYSHRFTQASKLRGDLSGALLGVSSEGGDVTAVLDASSLSGAYKKKISFIGPDGQVMIFTPAQDNLGRVTMEASPLEDPRAAQIGERLADGSIIGPVSPTSLTSFNYVSPAKSLTEPCSFYEAERHAAQLREEGYKNARLLDIHEWAVTRHQIIVPGKNQHTEFAHTYGQATADTRNWTATTPKSTTEDVQRAYVYTSHPTASIHKQRDIADKGAKAALAHFIFDA